VIILVDRVIELYQTDLGSVRSIVKFKVKLTNPFVEFVLLSLHGFEEKVGSAEFNSAYDRQKLQLKTCHMHNASSYYIIELLWHSIDILYSTDSFNHLLCRSTSTVAVAE